MTPFEIQTKLVAEAQRAPFAERVIGIAAPHRAQEMKGIRLNGVLNDCLLEKFAFNYEAAEVTRLRNFQGNLQQPPESSQISRQRVNMLMAARNIVENDPFIDGVLRKYAVYAYGNLHYMANTGDDVLDEQIDEYFEGWMERCDITGRHNLRVLSQLALREERTCGDCGIIFINDPASGELRLQMVEGDCLGHPYQSQIAPDYVNGVVINSYGKPVAYRVYQRNRLTAMYFDPVDVPAEYFLHYFDPFRVSFYRGISAFHSVINTVLDRREMREAMRLRVKYASIIAALITTKSGTLTLQDYSQGNSPAGGYTKHGDKIIEAPFAQMRFLAPGEDVKEFKADFPSKDIQTFDDSLLKDISNCLNLSYGFLRDLASLTGPGVRAVLAQDDREFDSIRKNGKHRMLNPIRNRVLFQAAATGVIKCNPTDPRLYRGDWYFPSKLTIDLGRDTESDIRLNAAGLLPFQDIAADDGANWKKRQDKILNESQRREGARLASRVPLEKSDIRIVTAAGAEVRAEATIESASTANNAPPVEAQA